MADLRRREAIESFVLALVGAAGVVIGLRTLAPKQIAVQPAPLVEQPEGGFPEVPTSSVHVADYRLTAKLDPDKHVVEGSGTITLHNTSTAALHEVRLHLYLNGFKNDQTLFRRARVAGFRGDQEGAPGYIDVKTLTLEGRDLWPEHQFQPHVGESLQDPFGKDATSPVEGAPIDETDVVVPLGEKEIAPGDSATFEVTFHDQLPAISERTGYHEHFHFVGQWFPKLARLMPDGTWASFPFHHVAEFYSDYGEYDVTLDVPQAYVVGASGHLLDRKNEGGRRIERYQVADVHDFAWTAWDDFVVREANEGSIAIHLLAPKGYESAVDRELISVVTGLRNFGARFGAYPYADLTVVHPPSGAEEAGGMEYPTLITTGGPWWPAHGSGEIEGVTVHELGHQWFYGLLGTHEVEWPAGDEGFNSYGEIAPLKSLLGEGTVVTIGDLDLDYLAISRRGTDPVFDETIFQPAYEFANGRSYGGRVYGATSVVLETLRRTYPRFEMAMGVYTRRHRFQHPTPDDFFHDLAEIAGDDCAAAAKTALAQPGGLDVYVEQVIAAKRHTPTGWFDPPSGRVEKKDESDGKGSHGYANVTWIGRRGAPIDLPIEVELRFADGGVRREVVRFGPTSPSKHPGNGSWRRIDADGPSALVSVVVDPAFRIVMDRSRLDNWATTAGNGGGAPVTRERAVAWLELLARSFGP
jgi:hypothetical protein